MLAISTTEASTLALALATVALAFFTWRLAKNTAALDKRTAEREQKARERQVRGVARLVDGELRVAQSSFHSANEQKMWSIPSFPIPTGAWDRDGSLLAQTLTQEEAILLIDLFTRLAGWRGMVTGMFGHAPPEVGPPPLGPDQLAIVQTLHDRVLAARQNLHHLAYPDASPGPPQPPPPSPKGPSWT